MTSAMQSSPGDCQSSALTSSRYSATLLNPQLKFSLLVRKSEVCLQIKAMEKNQLPTHACMRLARSLVEGLVPAAPMGLWPPEIIPDMLWKEESLLRTEKHTKICFVLH